MASRSDLVPAGDDSPFEILRRDAAELQDIISENVGSDSLTEFDLDRIKVPAGGGTAWEVPTLEGEETTKTIEGVIVHWANRRAYWPDAFTGENNPPQCSSPDGIQGYGDPGVKCAECVFAQWGSADDGAGQACKATRQLFVLTPDSIIPVVVTLPPASLAPAKKYFLRLVRAGLSATQVVTKLGLEKASSKSGITYSRVTFSVGDRLDPEAHAKVKAYAEQLSPAFAAAGRIERSDVE